MYFFHYGPHPGVITLPIFGGSNNVNISIYPIPSMYGYICICWIFMINVGKYTIHGWYGYGNFEGNSLIKVHCLGWSNESPAVGGASGWGLRPSGGSHPEGTAECKTTLVSAWRIIPFSKWLITMVSKSPNWGCSLYKWPKWLINGGY